MYAVGAARLLPKAALHRVARAGWLARPAIQRRRRVTSPRAGRGGHVLVGTRGATAARTPRDGRRGEERARPFQVAGGRLLDGFIGDLDDDRRLELLLLALALAPLLLLPVHVLVVGATSLVAVAVAVRLALAAPRRHGRARDGHVLGEVSHQQRQHVAHHRRLGLQIERRVARLQLEYFRVVHVEMHEHPRRVGHVQQLAAAASLHAFGLELDALAVDAHDPLLVGRQRVHVEGALGLLLQLEQLRLGGRVRLDHAGSLRRDGLAAKRADALDAQRAADVVDRHLSALLGRAFDGDRLAVGTHAVPLAAGGAHELAAHLERCAEPRASAYPQVLDVLDPLLVARKLRLNDLRHWPGWRRNR
mmetsp:Transcript_78997/g.191028  ORF Transcript_78997/g.191028 Transcript_78997/m.191028 type:complete len:362 (+) Transcript_78997:162-1247(+)